MAEKTRGGRTRHTIPLRDPDACPQHGTVYSRVINTIHHGGYIERIHACHQCGERWPSYQWVVNPRFLTVRALRLVMRHTNTTSA